MGLKEGVTQERVRGYIVDNLQPIIFLASYFLTVVLGQILIVMPLGSDWLRIAGLPTKVLQLGALSDPGYWILLLLPFLIVPLATSLIQRLLRRRLIRLWEKVPEFGRVDYAVVTGLGYAYMAFSFVRAGVFGFLFKGDNFTGSVNARFDLLGNLGFPPLVVLQSLLFFACIYSIAQALVSRGRFWIVAAVANVPLMAVLLFSLNMKWPIVVFFIAIGLTVLIYSRRNPLLKTAAIFLSALIVFFLVTAFVWRLQLSRMVQDIGNILIAASLRMSNPPYYYSSYQENGQICGGIIGQMRFHPKCRPSTHIYSQIFGNDGFSGIGTAPATGHITAFALNGWGAALIVLLLVALTLAMSACLPARTAPMIGTLSVILAVAAYHFSQVPVEGPFLYDHGVVWLASFLGLYFGGRVLLRRLAAHLDGYREPTLSASTPK